VKNINRTLSAGLLILSILLSSCTIEKVTAKIAKGNALTIVVVTDLHFLDASLFDLGPAFIKYSSAGDGRMLRYNNEIVDAFVSKMIETKPDIMIVSGDLTNNGEKISHEKLAEKFKLIEEAGVRVYVIPGNHDIMNTWAREFNGDKQIEIDTITWTEFPKIYEDFGYDEALLRDKTTLSYLATPSDDLWLLMLDTNHYSKSKYTWQPYSNGSLPTETLEWIREVDALAKAQGARLLTVMHHNLVSHNDLFTGYTLDNSYEVKTLFHELGLNLVLSGHLHVQDIRMDPYSADPLTDIVTSTLQMYPYQYGTLHYDPKTGFDYETAQLDVESWAKANHLTDENLLNFNAYSQTWSTTSSYNKASSRLIKLGLYTEDQVDEMAKTMALLNLYYFSGRSDQIRDEILDSQGYKEWVKATEPEFTRDYILWMTRKSIYDNNHFHID